LTTAGQRTPAKSPWDGILPWAGLVLLVYALHDVFLVAFLTFLLVYLVRAIVVPLARRIGQGRERPGLERWLTLGTFGAIIALLWGLAAWIGPQFVLQGRLLAAHAQRLDPQDALDHLLERTVGAYLFGQTYGVPGDPRYQAAFEQFTALGRAGEGAYAEFARVQAGVQAGFEVAYEQAERARLNRQVQHSGGDGQGFQDFAGQSQERARLEAERAAARAASEWQRFQASAGYRQAFRAWFDGPQGRSADVPYNWETYLALRDAYPQGLATFDRVYQERVVQTADGLTLARRDFQRAMELDLARQWWASSPVAASLREHLKQDAAKAAAAVADRLASGARALIAVPAQVGTALLLTILITFDMAGLKQGALRLRQTRLAGLYAQVVPNLTAVARLIGRSFAAQGLIAVFNTLLTVALMRLLGLHNEVLLGAVVFIASFIPVLGVILAAIPIGLQALLQPDGSLALAAYALAGIAAIHALEATVLSPRIVGKSLHLHPVLVLAVLLVGEHLFGIWGLLLGVPMSVYVIHAGVLAEPIPGVYEPPPPDG
jgi:predicted PurR-regulated permease PerM